MGLFFFRLILKRGIGARGYGDNVSLTTILSEIPYPWDPTKQFLGPTDEPYVWMLYKNIFPRMKPQHDWKNKKDAVGNFINNHKKFPNWSRKNEANPEYAGMFKAEYSQQNEGKCIYSSWSYQGIGDYNDICTEYVEAKYVNPDGVFDGTNLAIKEEWKAWERRYLEKARTLLGIGQPAADEANNQAPEEPAAPQVFPIEFQGEW